jgi:hypothetical protein
MSASVNTTTPTTIPGCQHAVACDHDRIEGFVRRLPRLASDLVLLEVALYASLGCWILRRPDVPPGTTETHYGRLAVPLIWLWIFGSAVEVVAADLILSRWWTFLRIPVLALGIWGLIWMLGLMAAHRVRPHLLGDEELVVRSPTRTTVRVPLESVTGVAAVDGSIEGIRFVKVVDGRLFVAVSGNTNLELTLAPETVLTTNGVTSLGEVTPSSICLWVDEPREVAALLRRRTVVRPQ